MNQEPVRNFDCYLHTTYFKVMGIVGMGTVQPIKILFIILPKTTLNIITHI